ncbi:MAG: DsbC family protein [Deltaproteobacteria bacterium]|nr:DsbC family protein [Deltaproteobacteria bacterium]
MKSLLFRLSLAALLLASAGTGAFAFMKEGYGSGECKDCHSLTREEAGKLLAGIVDNVLNVEESPVQGLWVVDIVKGGRKIPIYIDYSKKYVLSGQVLHLGTKADLTAERMRKLNEVKADFSRIPLEDALVVGNPSAKRKVVVFSDPDCHYCAMLHGELKTVIEKKPDVAFFVKLYSRNNDPASMEKAKSIICAKSLALLEGAYAGKPLPPAACRTDAPGQTLKLAGQLNIQGTPALVLPDGRVMTGYRKADALMELLAESAPSGAGGGRKEESSR